MQFFRSLKSLQLIFLAYINNPKNLNLPSLVHKRILQCSFPFPIKWWTKLMDELGHVERSCVNKMSSSLSSLWWLHEQCLTPVSSTDPFKPTTVGSRKRRSGDDDFTPTRCCSCANIKHIGQSTNHRCANCCSCGQTSEQYGRVGDSRADLRLLSKCRGETLPHPLRTFWPRGKLAMQLLTCCTDTKT